MKFVLYLLLSGLATNVAEGGLHLATRGLLQTHASLAGRGIALYPAHSPGHETDDVEHLAPARHHVLYYAQEGHRPAKHGAKHATLKANFSRPTIIFDHTSHLQSIQCDDGKIQLCLSSRGFGKARSTWSMHQFNLVTYHIGCGDETTGQRSYFLAETPQFNDETGCVDIAAKPIAYEDAIDSGEIIWGTYRDPQQQNTAVKGYVSVRGFDVPQPLETRAQPPPPPPRQRFAGPLHRRRTGKFPMMRRQDNGTIDPDDEPPFPAGDGTPSDSSPADITDDLQALINFFQTDEFDTSDIDDILSWFEDLDFIQFDGTVWTEEEEKAGTLDKRKLALVREALVRRRRLQKRSVISFFEGIYNACKKFVEKVGSWVKGATQKVTKVVQNIVTVAVIAAKVFAVPFAVPFDESYKNDSPFNYTASGSASNRPPAIFGYNDGFNLASSGGAYSIQCAKCRVQGESSVEGRLAFSIQQGITEGHVALVNDQNFNVDAIFGITLEVQYNKPIEVLEQPIAHGAYEPTLRIAGSLDLVLNGKAELLIGGSLQIAPGEARLSVMKRENKLTGFAATFTPVAKFGGSLTASAELGLPISIEVGVDVLNGKFRKTVGLTHKPSVYGAAALNINMPPICRGVVLSVGVKNRIYVSAIGLWDYDMRTDVVYERALGCVTIYGFNSLLSLPDPLVTTTVPAVVGGDIANIKPNISDVAQKLTHNTTNNMGFRVIMDEDKSSILVSGRDGYVYLVDTTEGYDLSSPWGSVNLTSGSVSLDVFGRVISYCPDNHLRVAMEIRVFEPTKIPKNFQSAAFTVVRPSGKERYVVAVTRGTVTATFYPTFCKTASGLRLYGTYYIVDKDGVIRTNPGFVPVLREGMKDLGVADVEKDCRTVQLSSV